MVDGEFLGANLVKLPQGGWFPLALALVLFFLMTTWKQGNQLVFAREQNMEMRLGELLEYIRAHPPIRTPGTAIFLSANPVGAPASLLANIRHNGVLNEHVLLITVVIGGVPHVAEPERISGEGLYRVTVRYGFMEEPNLPQALMGVALPELAFDPYQVPYFVNPTRAIASKMPGMVLWRERLYTIMRHNAASPDDFFRLPRMLVFEIQTSVEV